jgi:DnaJ-class molecular chaperone
MKPKNIVVGTYYMGLEEENKVTNTQLDTDVLCPYCNGTGEDPTGSKCLECKGEGVMTHHDND